MAKWIFVEFHNGLERYKCSSCGYVKDIIHSVGTKRIRADGTPAIFRCPDCKKVIKHERIPHE